MRLLPEKSTLVVVGAFNPAILNPSWIAKNALGIIDDRQVQVEMLTPVSIGLSAPPARYSFEGISYSVTSQRLTVHFEGLDEAGAIKSVRMVRRIFELLHHTPVTGVGFNFGFASERPSAKLTQLMASEVSLLEGLADDAAIVMQGWGNTVRLGEELLGIQCTYDAASVSIDVNAHRNLSDATGLVAVVADDGVFATHLAQAIAIAVQLNEGELE